MLTLIWKLKGMYNIFHLSHREWLYSVILSYNVMVTVTYSAKIPIFFEIFLFFFLEKRFPEILILIQIVNTFKYLLFLV